MATINYNSGNINVSFFPTNSSAVWFCDKNTGGINVGTNGAPILANTLQLGNVNTITNISGTMNAGVVNSFALTTNLELGKTQTSGTLTIGDSSSRTGPIYLGNNTAGSILIGGSMTGSNYVVLGNVTNSSTQIRGKLIEIADNGGVVALGSVGSNVSVNGTLVTNKVVSSGALKINETNNVNTAINSNTTVAQDLTLGTAGYTTQYLRGATININEIGSGNTVIGNSTGGGTSLNSANTTVNGSLTAQNATFGNWKSFYLLDSATVKNYGCLSTQTGGLGLKNFALYQDQNVTILNHSNLLALKISDHEKMRVDANGNVGIGTTNPQYLLDVNGTAKINGTISGAAFIVVSDRRIKTNIVDVEDDSALMMFRKLKPKTYEYVDKIQKGKESVYGFIAQEVQEVLPRATKMIIDFVPNIYNLCTVTGDRITIDPSKLEYDSSGNLFKTLKIIKEDNTELFVQILNADPNTIQIDQTLSEEKIFVFGQEVNNFYSLDKNAIWTVASAALQEVDRQLQAEKEKTLVLQSNYEALLSRIIALESKGSA